MLKVLYREKEKNRKIFGYGASGRTNTILSYIDFYFDYIFDDSKYKIANYTHYYHTKILDSKDNKYDSKNIYLVAFTPEEFKDFREVFTKYKEIYGWFQI